MATESSQRVTSSLTSGRTHDVFLSFRGADTRLSFADHVYSGLNRKGLLVFRDDEKLERGGNISEELLEAIQVSEYAVIIISENYAFSKWCLIELTEILKCKREKGLKVLPVFYHVEPRDVGKQERNFERAFAKHIEDKVDEEQMKMWRVALKEVSKLAGEDVRGRHESEVVEKICSEISNGLSRRTLEIADDLVGIESQTRKLITMLHIRDNNIRFIGICGIGGIGKTTLAEVIFNKVFSLFEAHCFISNVREASQKFGGMLLLQKDLVSQILGEKEPKIHNLFQGRRMIASRLKNKKVVIVLDDVDKEVQLEELVGKHIWFGEGSRVLITSQDGHLLKRYVDEIYEVEKLTERDAFQLFNMKAFKDHSYERNHAKLSEDIVKYAGGLPLAIKVFASSLFDCTIDAWKSVLDRNKVSLDSNILDRLQISFEGLDNPQKMLFLDIACFFKGEWVEDVIYKLKALGHFPENDIPILENKCLIKISENYKRNKLEMHNLLQEMGRQIVYRESPKKPGKRSRLWYYEDIIHVFKNNSGTDMIESIVLEMPFQNQVKLSFEAFSKMKNLKMLVIRPTCEFEAFCEEVYLCGLKWYKHGMVEWYGNPSKLILGNELCILEWWGFPFEHFPSSCDMDNLVLLKIPMSYIKQLWDVRKTFDKLKYIDLRHLHNSIETLDLSKIPNLEVFDARGTILRQLQASTTFPKKRQLQASTTFPKKLSILRVEGSYSNPISISFLGLNSHSSSLVDLKLRHCNMVDGVLPHDLGCLSSLKYLDLTGNKFTRLPYNICQLSNLSKLLLDDCTQLQTLPPDIFRLSKLFWLTLHNCTQLQAVPSKLPLCLEHMGIDFCSLLNSEVKLLTGNSSIKGSYFGYEDKPYTNLYLVPKSDRGKFRTTFINIAWGPTLKSQIPKWFNQRSTAFCRKNQCHMTLNWQDAGSSKTAYSRLRKNLFWGLALFIVYEIHEFDTSEREGSSTSRILDENNSISPIFVCQVKYGAGDSRVPIVFRVPGVPCGRNEVWVSIRDTRVLSNKETVAEAEKIEVSIKTKGQNLELKECAVRIIPIGRRKDFHNILKSISPRGLHCPESLDIGFDFSISPLGQKRTNMDEVPISTGGQKRSNMDEMMDEVMDIKDRIKERVIFREMNRRNRIREEVMDERKRIREEVMDERKRIREEVIVRLMDEMRSVDTLMSRGNKVRMDVLKEMTDEMMDDREIITEEVAARLRNERDRIMKDMKEEQLIKELRIRRATKETRTRGTVQNEG